MQNACKKNWTQSRLIETRRYSISRQNLRRKEKTSTSVRERSRSVPRRQRISRQLLCLLMKVRRLSLTRGSLTWSISLTSKSLKSIDYRWISRLKNSILDVCKLRTGLTEEITCKHRKTLNHHMEVSLEQACLANLVEVVSVQALVMQVQGQELVQLD